MTRPLIVIVDKSPAAWHAVEILPWFRLDDRDRVYTFAFEGTPANMAGYIAERVEEDGYAVYREGRW